ncbi:formin-like isoform X4 [Centruroides vittatus]|uniref:formin-like isoform X4 n=1 Tax=Centruroides vittatus TaxID=120091 RepID=UPI0035103326
MPSIWEGLVEKPNVSWEEFGELFGKQTSDKGKTSHRKRQRGHGKEVVRLLDQKRWQNLDLLISSLQVQIADIENAVYNIDTGAFNLQSLQALYDIRPTAEELEIIKNHLSTKPNIHLDRPEQFLYDLSQIPDYNDRLSCVMYQVTFYDYIGQVESKLNNFRMTCEFMLTSRSLQDVLNIILTLGNYMNGGSKSRGQADGFGLEILQRLKDIRSKDNTLTLLHYIVKIYVKLYNKDTNIDNLKLPVPEPSDVERASLLYFEEISAELKRIHSQMKGCEQRVEKIVRSSEESHHQMFGNKMAEFLKKAHLEYKEQKENLEESIHRMHTLKTFYCWQSRSTKYTDWPKEYFTLWIQFCYDFKDAWKKEIQRRNRDESTRTKKKSTKDKHGTAKGKSTPQKSKYKKMKTVKDSPPTDPVKQDQIN